MIRFSLAFIFKTLLNLLFGKVLYFKKTFISVFILFSLASYFIIQSNIDIPTDNITYLIIFVILIFIVAFVIPASLMGHLTEKLKQNKLKYQNNLGELIVDDMFKITKDKFMTIEEQIINFDHKYNQYFNDIKKYVFEYLKKENKGSESKIKKTNQEISSLENEILLIKKDQENKRDLKKELLKRHPFLKKIEQFKGN